MSKQIRESVRRTQGQNAREAKIAAASLGGTLRCFLNILFLSDLIVPATLPRRPQSSDILVGAAWFAILASTHFGASCGNVTSALPVRASTRPGLSSAMLLFPPIGADSSVQPRLVRSSKTKAQVCWCAALEVPVPWAVLASNSPGSRTAYSAPPAATKVRVRRRAGNRLSAGNCASPPTDEVTRAAIEPAGRASAGALRTWPERTKRAESSVKRTKMEHQAALRRGSGIALSGRNPSVFSDALRVALQI